MTTGDGSKELKEILNTNEFAFPKPSFLISFLLEQICDKNSIILDSFAGSGTTAHAVLNLNKQDGGNRKFILIEMEAYAETITAERVKRVIAPPPPKGEKKRRVQAAVSTISPSEMPFLLRGGI